MTKFIALLNNCNNIIGKVSKKKQTNNFYLFSQLLSADTRFCNENKNYRAPQLIVFMVAMILIGSGGTPIFTLGTIFIGKSFLLKIKQVPN